MAKINWPWFAGGVLSFVCFVGACFALQKSFGLGVAIVGSIFFGFCIIQTLNTNFGRGCTGHGRSYSHVSRDYTNVFIAFHVPERTRRGAFATGVTLSGVLVLLLWLLFAWLAQS